MDILSLFPHDDPNLTSVRPEPSRKGGGPMLETYLPFLARRRRITYEMLRSIQAVAEQVVMATEQTFRLTGEHKKEIALKVLSQILEEMGIEAPDPLLDIAIEAAVRAMKMLERASEPAA